MSQNEICSRYFTVDFQTPNSTEIHRVALENTCIWTGRNYQLPIFIVAPCILKIH